MATSDSVDRGFWQLPLDEESKLLTTFVISFGRYSFNRLPFGTSSAPEIFQRTMSEILKGCRWRNMANGWRSRPLSWSRKTLQTCSSRTALSARDWYNRQQWELRVFQDLCIKFLGSIIDEQEIVVDPMKTEAISQFPPPQTVKDLQRFRGIVIHLGKFIPRLAENREPLRQLLCKDTT